MSRLSRVVADSYGSQRHPVKYNSVDENEAVVLTPEEEAEAQQSLFCGNYKLAPQYQTACKWLLTALGLTLAAVAGFFFYLQSMKEPLADTPDPFDALSGGFQKATVSRITNFKTNMPFPIVITANQSMVLLYSDSGASGNTVSVHRVEADQFLTDAWSLLKLVSHVPVTAVIFAVDLALPPAYNLDAVTPASVQTYMDQLSAAKEHIYEVQFETSAQYHRQLAIINDTLAFLADVLEDPPAFVSPTGLPANATRILEYTSSLEASLRQNSDDASRLMVDGMRSVLSQWRPQLTDEQWSQVAVVACGPLAKLQFEFFRNELSVNQTAGRLFLAEDAVTEEDALNVVAQFWLGVGTGFAFFEEQGQGPHAPMSAYGDSYLQELHGQGKVPSYFPPSACPFS